MSIDSCWGGSGMSVYGGAGGRPSSSCGGGRMSCAATAALPAPATEHAAARSGGSRIAAVLSSKQFPAPLLDASARSAVPLPDTSLFVIWLLAEIQVVLPIDRGDDDDAVARAARHLVLLDQVVDAADQPDADPVVAAERRLARYGHTCRCR